MEIICIYLYVQTNKLLLEICVNQFCQKACHLGIPFTTLPFYTKNPVQSTPFCLAVNMIQTGFARSWNFQESAWILVCSYPALEVLEKW